MSKLMQICEVGWELYDEWCKLIEKKEKAKDKNKDLDRRVGIAWKMYRAHVRDCPSCHDPLNEL